MFVFCCLTEEADDDGVWGCFGRDCCRLPRQLLHVNNNQQTNTIEGQIEVYNYAQINFLHSCCYFRFLLIIFAAPI